MSFDLGLALFPSSPPRAIREIKEFAAHIDGLVQDCSNSSALATELLQSCTKPSIYTSPKTQNLFFLHISAMPGQNELNLPKWGKLPEQV